MIGRGNCHVRRFGRRLACWLLCAVFLLQVGLSSAGAAGLDVFPSQVEFHDIYARRQLIVSREQSDVTRQATFTSNQPQVVRVDARGFVTPLTVGDAEIVIQHQGVEARVPVRVQSLDSNRPIDFSNEIVPLLSRVGCKAGGGHGKASGQNGFKLSLFGFDTNFDYQALALEGRGRRVFASSAEQSLLLRKATGQAPHGGGRRIEPETEAYHLIQHWIEQGLPRTVEKSTQLVSIKVFPPERLMRTGAEPGGAAKRGGQRPPNTRAGGAPPGGV